MKPAEVLAYWLTGTRPRTKEFAMGTSTNGSDWI
ncbi:MAG: hypothetical protein K0S37_3516, partial [Microbacterium sp.]|nr:hypothetical protein [Microbacterium sp.]